MKVLVTGHRGYVGAHLVALLKEAGHRVPGYDLELFPSCEWEAAARPDVEPIADVRSLTARQLGGYDAVCHLAAISNDPMGDLNEALTVSVNRDGSIHLARIGKQTGVPRYLISGSCSVWGRAGTARARAASRAGSHARSATAWDWRRRWRSWPARYTPSRPCA